MTKPLAEQFEEKFTCIQDGCDGKGNIPHQVGENQWEAEQCQFCFEIRFPLIEMVRTAEAEIRADQKEITKAVMTINRQAEYDRIEKSAYERGRADERARVKEWAKEQKKKTIEQINMIHGANMSAACELAYRDALSDLLSFLTKENDK